MVRTRIYKPQLKAPSVLLVLSGTKSAAQVCRDLNTNENLLSRWKLRLLTHAAQVFERETEASEKDDHIAELERLVGTLTMELEVANKFRNLPLIKRAKTGGDCYVRDSLSRPVAV